ncbi:hypothetical protein LO749_02425 [Paracoccus denitrificans]|uniref:hypothetical protein n=1 Tax=Paracoccus denitrificans TaxID=266 RepID=UPI001E592C21|nr:hypothetical protein [Paracoccus denitrificans]UFS65436.1 hypothetical protein LO749_02425 [Paracoccus denitrificans]
MARGFATGLVHGALVCGAALVGLSLALPQPPRSQAPSAEEGPAAETLSIPAGSEFDRASDMQPQAPALLSADDRRPAETPMVQRPADESAPVQADPVGLRPEAPADGPAAPEIALPEPDPVDLPDPATEAPIPVPPPGKVVVPALDRAPERAPSAPDLPPQPAVAMPETGAATEETASPAVTSEPAPQAEALPETAVPAEAPAIGSGQGRDATPQPAADSAPDLSMPPDFGALRLND